MTEPFLERLEHQAEHEAARVLEGITSHFGHHRYHDRNSLGFVPEEHSTMSLATIEADIRTGIQEGMDKAADLYNHFKGIAEEKAPELAAEVQKIQNSKIAQTLEGVVLTPAEEEMVSRIIEELPGLRVSVSTPAAPDAPAQPADPTPSPSAATTA